MLGDEIAVSDVQERTQIEQAHRLQELDRGLLMLAQNVVELVHAVGGVNAHGKPVLPRELGRLAQLLDRAGLDPLGRQNGFQTPTGLAVDALRERDRIGEDLGSSGFIHNAREPALRAADPAAEIIAGPR